MRERTLSVYHGQLSSSFLKLGLLVLFLFALGLRLAYFTAVRAGSLDNPDTPAYEALADAISTGQPYVTSHPAGPGGFPADLHRPPGYPLFLSLISLRSRVSRVQTAAVQSVLGALFAVLLAVLVGRLVSAPAGLLAGLFYAIDWATILHTPLVIAETIFTVVLTLAISTYAFFLYRQRGLLALAAGLLLGVAALVKPIAQIVVVSLLLAWVFQPKRRWVGLAFLLTYAATVTPWMMRNYQRHGIFTLSAISTVVTYFYTAQGAAGDYSWRDLTTDELSARVMEVTKRWDTASLSPAERKWQMDEEARVLIRQHWPAVLKQAVVGLVRTCVGTGRETMTAALPGTDRPRPLWSTVLPLVQVFFLWVFAAIGVVVAFRKALVPRAVLVLLVAAVALILLPVASPVGYSRYRVPAVPILCILAAVGAAPVTAKAQRAPSVAKLFSGESEVFK